MNVLSFSLVIYLFSNILSYEVHHARVCYQFPWCQGKSLLVIRETNPLRLAQIMDGYGRGGYYKDNRGIMEFKKKLGATSLAETSFSKVSSIIFLWNKVDQFTTCRLSNRDWCTRKGTFPTWSPTCLCVLLKPEQWMK